MSVQYDLTSKRIAEHTFFAIDFNYKLNTFFVVQFDNCLYTKLYLNSTKACCLWKMMKNCGVD